jgi:hypothetical protein
MGPLLPRLPSRVMLWARAELGQRARRRLAVAQVPDLRLLCPMRSECKFNPREVADLEGMVEQGRQQLPKFYSEVQTLRCNCTVFFHFCPIEWMFCQTGASHFCSPHPKSLSQAGRGTLNPAPLRPFWAEGLEDEGKFAKVGCSSARLTDICRNHELDCRGSRSGGCHPPRIQSRRARWIEPSSWSSSFMSKRARVARPISVMPAIS